MRPYHSAYHPFKWRGWWDFGCGALGDMAVHNADPAFYALGLGAPDWVEAETSPSNNDSFPAWNIVRYHFPPSGSRPEVKLTWYDGGKMPKDVPFLEPDRKLADNGCIFIGDKAGMMGGSHANAPRLLPEAKMKEFTRPRADDPALPRPPDRMGPGGHRRQTRGCKEWVLVLGAVHRGIARRAARRALPKAYRVGSTAMKAKNCAEADPIIRKAYREGWKLPA